MQTRINITLPQELVKQLRAEIPKRQRSGFIARTLQENLKKQKAIKEQLIKGLKANYKLDEKIHKEWERVDLENWPVWEE